MAFMSFLCSMQYVDQYALVAGNAATRADHRNHTRPPMTLRETCIVYALYATWKDCKMITLQCQIGSAPSTAARPRYLGPTPRGVNSEPKFIDTTP